MKKKTYKELEEDNFKKKGIIIGLTIACILIFIVACLYLIEVHGMASNLESQLSKCQGKVPSCDIEYGYYGFEVVCYDDYFGKNNIGKPIDQHYFNSLYDCKETLDSFIDDKNCEVLDKEGRRK